MLQAPKKRYRVLYKPCIGLTFQQLLGDICRAKWQRERGSIPFTKKVHHKYPIASSKTIENDLNISVNQLQRKEFLSLYTINPCPYRSRRKDEISSEGDRLLKGSKPFTSIYYSGVVDLNPVESDQNQNLYLNIFFTTV